MNHDKTTINNTINILYTVLIFICGPLLLLLLYPGYSELVDYCKRIHPRWRMLNKILKKNELTNLHLNECELVNHLDAEISHLPRLLTINAHSSKITGKNLSRILTKSSNLQKLYLSSYINIDSLVSIMPTIQNLHTLDVSYTKIDSQMLVILLSKIPNLEELVLKGTRNIQDLSEEMQELPRLKKIVTNGSNLRWVGFSNLLRKSLHLQILSIDFNLNIEYNVRAIPQLLELREISYEGRTDIATNMLTLAELLNISPSLKVLSINYSKIKDALWPNNQIPVLHQLECIYASNTYLYNAGFIQLLLASPNLKKLFLNQVLMLDKISTLPKLALLDEMPCKDNCFVGIRTLLEAIITSQCAPNLKLEASAMKDLWRNKSDAEFEFFVIRAARAQVLNASDIEEILIRSHSHRIRAYVLGLLGNQIELGNALTICYKSIRNSIDFKNNKLTCITSMPNWHLLQVMRHMLTMPNLAEQNIDDFIFNDKYGIFSELSDFKCYHTKIFEAAFNEMNTSQGATLLKYIDILMLCNTADVLFANLMVKLRSNPNLFSDLDIEEIEEDKAEINKHLFFINFLPSFTSKISKGNKFSSAERTDLYSRASTLQDGYFTKAWDMIIPEKPKDRLERHLNRLMA